MAPAAGRVVELLELLESDTIPADQVVAIPDTSHATEVARSGTPTREETWVPLLEQVQTLKDLALERLKPGSEDPGVVRQRTRGKLTCRERIELLLDDGSFHEIGSVAGFASTTRLVTLPLLHPPTTLVVGARSNPDNDRLC